MSRLSNKTVASSITINVMTSINKRPRSRLLLINVYVNIQTMNRRYSQQWCGLEDAICICSCQWCIKSKVFCGNCWTLRRRLEAATGCRRGPQYDGKFSFYLNCYFFRTSSTNRDLREKAVYFPPRPTMAIMEETLTSGHTGIQLLPMEE